MAHGDDTTDPYDDRDEPDLITMTIRYDLNTGEIALDVTGEPELHEALGILELAKMTTVDAARR